jgi:hypothetical protein
MHARRVEIDQLEIEVFLVVWRVKPDNILRLQVAMHHLMLLQCFQTIHDLLFFMSDELYCIPGGWW